MDFRSEEHTSELQSRSDLVCRLLLEKKKIQPTSSALPRRASGRTPSDRGAQPSPHQALLASTAVETETGMRPFPVFFFFFLNNGAPPGFPLFPHPPPFRF